MPTHSRGDDRAEGGIGFSLYLITDRHQTNGRSLAAVVRDALEGGVRVVQVREKDLPGSELFVLATELRRITREYGAKLLINERIDIAMAVAADGIHIGASSIPVSEARRVLGPERLIGYSAHAVDGALQAAADGADFVTFGPVYFTPSKAAYGEPAGVEKLAEAANRLTIPVFALGGIKHENIGQVMAAGAHGVALISAIIASPDPRTATVSLLQKIKQHANHP